MLKIIKSFDISVFKKNKSGDKIIRFNIDNNDNSKLNKKLLTFTNIWIETKF